MCMHSVDLVFHLFFFSLIFCLCQMHLLQWLWLFIPFDAQSKSAIFHYAGICSNRYPLRWLVNSNICSELITSKSNLRLMWPKTFQYIHSGVYFKYVNYEIFPFNRENLKISSEWKKSTRTLFVLWVSIFRSRFPIFLPPFDGLALSRLHSKCFDRVPKLFHILRWPSFVRRHTHLKYHTSNSIT